MSKNESLGGSPRDVHLRCPTKLGSYLEVAKDIVLR
jgi:hypothetical protein